MYIIFSKNAALDKWIWYYWNSGSFNCSHAAKFVHYSSYFTCIHLQSPIILLMTYEILQGSTFDFIHKDSMFISPLLLTINRIPPMYWLIMLKPIQRRLGDRGNSWKLMSLKLIKESFIGFILLRVSGFLAGWNVILVDSLML